MCKFPSKITAAWVKMSFRNWCNHCLRSIFVYNMSQIQSALLKMHITSSCLSHYYSVNLDLVLFRLCLNRTNRMQDTLQEPQLVQNEIFFHAYFLLSSLSKMALQTSHFGIRIHFISTLPT